MDSIIPSAGLFLSRKCIAGIVAPYSSFLEAANAKEVQIMGNEYSISRRSFLKTSVVGAVVAATVGRNSAMAAQGSTLRLGGPVFEKTQDPQGWIGALKKLGYSAAYCPVGPNAGDDVVRAYEEAAAKAGIIIAEVGAWSNPISPDEPTRKAALEKCRTSLALADRIGARCCVNIAGTRSTQWDGPDAANFTQGTFDMIVE
ncbi:MAG: hypothetical protein EHM35_06925, partial [Planctomycetaceae bacterium]